MKEQTLIQKYPLPIKKKKLLIKVLELKNTHIHKKKYLHDNKGFDITLIVRLKKKKCPP